MHYSHTCPVVAYGKRRVEIITTQGRCRICLVICADQCRNLSSSKCQYCRDVDYAVYEDLIPTREPSDREVVCRHVTLYASWQEGFYERLIRSAKTSIIKAIGKAALPFEELATESEVGSLLNTRPLLYIDSTFDPSSILRPIDFLQRDLQVSFPFASLEEDSEHLTFTLRVRTQYLTTQREKHQLQVDTRRAGAVTPKVGSLVLLQEETLPRCSWKLDRIENLVENSQDITRETRTGRSISEKGNHERDLISRLKIIDVIFILIHALVGIARSRQ
ncbi:unnamed protein product [Nippostrongylus brasiliensis]|uniref:DUF5641 domain-containing protein n=1 Tax=Nippostrongylus brasiliensis TaxID=27835 RepID=A0A0N4YKT2_NIPBR|nr:unnamed protein product [Nippostrongylus brasiliensis]